MKKNFRTEHFNFWFSTRSPQFDISFEKCGYFDGRPRFILYLIWFGVSIILPWVNKKWTDECDPPKYGIAIHGNTFWIYTGGKGNFGGGRKFIAWDLPWFTKKFYKHYILGKDGSWIDVTYRRYDSQERKKFEKEIGYLNFDGDVSDEDSLAQIYYGTWIDHYDNSLIPAKYRVEIRQWRPKWFGWTKLFQIERKSIDVAFKYEVGSGKGSWKGGVLGTGCDFKEIDDDKPYMCFIRMNREKKW